MDHIKTNKNKIRQLINSCEKTQTQLQQLKKSLTFYNKQLNPFKSKNTKENNHSSFLIKNTNKHMDLFQKRTSKINLHQSAFISINESDVFSPQKPPNSVNSELIKQNLLKRRKINNYSQHVSYSKQKGKILQNTQKRIKKPQQKQEEDQLTTSKLIKQNSDNFLPKINFSYQQTFSPRNASLSQQAMVKKQLQKSIFRKSHQEKCQQYNKENSIREQKEKKKIIQQKFQIFRLNVLKKISYENVKKYLYHEKKRKQARSVALQQLSKMHKSLIQGN